MSGYRGQSVLIVDDDVEIISILTDVLRAAGYQVVTASSAREANIKLSRQRFQGVVVDLHLGAESGEEVLKFMRSASEVNLLTPAVVISAFVDAPVLHRVRPYVQGVLVKPFRPGILIERLKLAREMGVLLPEAAQG